MGIFDNPLSHVGAPPGGTGTPSTMPSAVRAATTAEATAGTLNDVYLSPATASSIGAGANFASPPALGFGSTTPQPVHATILSATGSSAIGSGAGVASRVGNTTGTVGFFGQTGATRVTQAAVTNSVTAGGTTGTIANYTDLSVYANDAAAIRNDIYQLSLALSNVVGALRSYGLLA